MMQSLTTKTAIIIASILILTSVIMLAAVIAFKNAVTPHIIEPTQITKDSTVQIKKNTTTFSLYSSENSLYTTHSSGEAGAKEFLETRFQYGSDGSLLPQNISNQIHTQRSEEDKTANHFFFEQQINGVPVYGSSIVVHIKNGNQVYGADASIINSQDIPPEKIDVEQAKQIAIQEAQKENQSNLEANLESKYIFNYALMGIKSDTSNYIAAGIRVKAPGQFSLFNTLYLVDLVSGKILYSSSSTAEALNRELYVADGNNSLLMRREGELDSDNTDVNSAYTILGDIYNYFETIYGRDSYDDKGGKLKGVVNVTDSLLQTKFCPNAAWSDQYKTIFICKGMVQKDVIAHEMTHALTSSTANLAYTNQSGALNEGFSDVFASAFDDNWSIGEGSAFKDPPYNFANGILRYLDDPTHGPRSQPDSLFSRFYVCSQSQDKGGVHTNSGVLAKAFYLMAHGDTFNGCTIKGIGKEKVLPIFYKALTTYLRPTSNFKDAYNKLLQSCSDLYGSSSDCAIVKSALQAVAMDQQSDVDQLSPVCSGKVMEKPACASTNTVPTITPQPTITNTTIPTIPISQTPAPTPKATVTPIPTHVQGGGGQGIGQIGGFVVPK